MVKMVCFKEGDFVIAPSKIADTFTRNDPSVDAVYDYRSRRLIWRDFRDDGDKN